MLLFKLNTAEPSQLTYRNLSLVNLGSTAHHLPSAVSASKLHYCWKIFQGSEHILMLLLLSRKKIFCLHANLHLVKPPVLSRSHKSPFLCCITSFWFLFRLFSLLSQRFSTFRFLQPKKLKMFKFLIALSFFSYFHFSFFLPLKLPLLLLLFSTL